MAQKADPDPALTASIRILYQPVVRLDDLRTAYVEVLTRSESALGVVGGAETIVDAMTGPERSMSLTESIMERSLGEYVGHDLAAFGLPLAFNLPLDAMLHPGLVARIEAERARFGVASGNIRFELTERHPVHDLAAARAVISSLRDAGYGLALDDITPGMTHLPELMAMPIRAVKLDRSVVTGGRQRDRVFIRRMAAAAGSQGLDVIAEGIETEALCAKMRRLGATHGQGFLFSHPVRAAELRAFLDNAPRA
jgi:EAL domain-containing protein (putative c-di-GMP-specific phosphodiesterase class I)